MLGFAMGPYGCMERTWKPFNPLLGETFEVDLDNGVRFFAEQVSLSFSTTPAHPTTLHVARSLFTDNVAHARQHLCGCSPAAPRLSLLLTHAGNGCKSRKFGLQVSHHPPIGVGHGENDNWTYDIVSAPSTKFLGNSVEIYPVGKNQAQERSSAPFTTTLRRPIFCFYKHLSLCSIPLGC